jgi:hypothetical protein
LHHYQTVPVRLKAKHIILPAITLSNCDADVAVTWTESQNIPHILKCSQGIHRDIFSARLHQATARVSTECVNIK